MVSRGHTLAELVVAITLFLVMLPALFPPPRPAAQALRGSLEAQIAARIAAGELTEARRDAAAGGLGLGREARRAARWESTRHLPQAQVEREVSAGPEAGLLEVVVRVRWRSLAGDPGEVGAHEARAWIRGEAR